MKTKRTAATVGALSACLVTLTVASWASEPTAAPTAEPTVEPTAEPATEVTAAIEQQEGEHGAAEHGDEHGYAFVHGVKGSYLASFAHGEVHHLGGGGVFVEASVIHHWLELEFAVRGLGDGHLLTFPMDLLFKVPLYHGELFQPFVGVGPTVIPTFKGADNSVHYGGVVTAGSYLWAFDCIGFVLEANYNMVDEHGLIHELGFNGGLAQRF